MSEFTLPSDPLETPLQQFILDLEGHLNRERASFAENAFGVGCSAIIVPVLLVVALSFLFGARGWVAFFLVLTSASLVAFVLVSLFANQAQGNAARRIFREEIEPALTSAQGLYNVSREELLSAAAGTLPASATLRQYLDLPTRPPTQTLDDSQLPPPSQ